jgi:hypothetical protein
MTRTEEVLKEFKKLNTDQERTAFFLGKALLAPSSHNTQPWLVKITASRQLTLYVDKKRQLTKSDVTGRMLYVSAGCFLASLEIAANYFGYDVRITVNKESITRQPKKVADVSFSNTNIKDDGTMFSGLLNRVTYRGSYKTELPNAEIVNAVSNLVVDAVKLEVFLKKEEIEELATIVARSMKRKMSDSNFRKELATWLRSNISMKRDGMPGFTHNMSMPVSFLVPWILRNVNVSEKERKKSLMRVKGFPAVAILTTPNDTASEWIASGISMQKALCYLAGHGLLAGIMVAPIEDVSGRQELRTFIKTKKNNLDWPQMFFGFGLPNREYRHSPRRQLSDILL